MLYFVITCVRTRTLTHQFIQALNVTRHVKCQADDSNQYKDAYSQTDRQTVNETDKQANTHRVNKTDRQTVGDLLTDDVTETPPCTPPRQNSPPDLNRQ